MARKNSSTIVQEELYPPAEDATRGEMDDARVLDLDVEQESPFLRAQKRVPARRGSLPKKTAARLTWVAAAIVVLCLGGVAFSAVYHYGKHSWRFRVESSDDIDVAGVENVTRSQVMDVMGGDIGRNIFFVPLAERQTQLEQLPWVESASVMRFVPNRLRVEIHERTPVAFARVGSKILLVDAGGTLMELPPANKKKYSFPVIVGMNPGEPLSTRAPRMKIYNDLISQLDSGGARYSQDLSEVDLSDPEDVKVLANNPEGEVLIHLGGENFLDRYKVYVAHVQEWRQQFDKLESVDLRYDRQIIVNPDMQGMAKPAPLSPAAVRAAMAAGVKPVSLVSRERLAAANLIPAPAKTPAKPIPAAAKPVAKAPAAKPANPVAASHAAPVAKPAAVKTAAVKPVKPAVAKSIVRTPAKPVQAAHKKPVAKKVWAKKAHAATAHKVVKPASLVHKTTGAAKKPAVNKTSRKPSPAIARAQEDKP
ncbi:MAG: FtsQ-type POTRA domain-containing protein [Acidobacteria bacterium]|nr:FtsQ-type POTRA domain-containing protein [Acidobacteriota bacterium]